ncbi:unnamed protein product [Chrysoparadoxa australica]
MSVWEMQTLDQIIQGKEVVKQEEMAANEDAYVISSDVDALMQSALLPSPMASDSEDWGNSDEASLSLNELLGTGDRQAVPTLGMGFRFSFSSKLSLSERGREAKTEPSPARLLTPPPAHVCKKPAEAQGGAVASRPPPALDLDLVRRGSDDSGEASPYSPITQGCRTPTYGSADEGADCKKVVDLELWDVVERWKVCNAKHCMYRNPVNHQAQRKHFHAKCDHLHMRGKWKGMPFHHHQVEKIFKHQRLHQRQSKRRAQLKGRSLSMSPMRAVPAAGKAGFGLSPVSQASAAPSMAACSHQVPCAIALGQGGSAPSQAMASTASAMLLGGTVGVDANAARGWGRTGADAGAAAKGGAEEGRMGPVASRAGSGSFSLAGYRSVSWMEAETDQLKEVVDQLGTASWDAVAARLKLPAKDALQCQLQWRVVSGQLGQQEGQSQGTAQPQSIGQVQQKAQTGLGGTWTSEEDAGLRKMMEGMGPGFAQDWSMVGRELGKTAGQCSLRWAQMKLENKYARTAAASAAAAAAVAPLGGQVASPSRDALIAPSEGLASPSPVPWSFVTDSPGQMVELGLF